MATTAMLEDLFAHGDWARRKLFALSDGLSDAQLDEAREIGFGSLRNTLFHLLAAEEIWVERWEGKPWRAFEFDAKGLPFAAIAERFDAVAQKRQAIMDRELPDGWQRVCIYKDSKGNEYRNRLVDLLWHVANHGVHHRAQALQYLRPFGRKVPGGLDYIFFRLAYPAVRQAPETVAAFRGYGLELETGAGRELAWNRPLLERYFAYGDWANGLLLALTAGLDDAQLDQSRAMGMDTIRKTALHLLDAERWWLKNWLEGPTAFDKWPESTPIERVREEWGRVIEARNRFIAELDDAGAARIVTALIGPTPVRFAVAESLVQLCGHGTHHRAQWVNMLRSCGQSPPGIDVIVWLRQ